MPRGAVPASPVKSFAEQSVFFPTGVHGVKELGLRQREGFQVLSVSVQVPVALSPWSRCHLSGTCSKFREENQ